jgi:catechol 2,3-dioxygenase-like lactoylglutathione lyase family enzyme
MGIRPVFAALALSATALAATPPERPRITGVAHIAIYAHDVNKARAFYTGFLGFEEPFTLRKPDGSLAVSFIKINDRQYVEISPEAAPETDRLNHISVETDNAEVLRAYLAAKGIAVPPKVGKVRIGNLSFNVKDPDGHTVEFVEYTPEGWSLREKGRHMGPNRVSDHMMHVGILVGDLARSAEFYGDVLGFKETWRGSRDEKTLNWVNMRVPDGDDYIEFMLYDKLPEPTKRGSAHHICLTVPEMGKTRAALEARAAANGYGRPLEVRTGINRRRQMNLFDPDGTRTEVMEPITVDGVPAVSSAAPAPGAH